MSRAPRFNTVPTDLLEHAGAATKHFKGRGYSISVEPQGKLHFPSTPAMLCKRTHTEVAVLVSGRIDLAAVTAWVSMAKNIRTDFRVAVCFPGPAKPGDHKNRQACRDLGVGLLESRDGQVFVLSEPLDQGLHISLPDLSTKPRKVREALGASFDHFAAGRWREGFDEACRCLEQRARPYLQKSVRAQRLTVLDGRGRPVRAEAIDRMTLGQLARAFDSAPQRNQKDDLIYRALAQINPDRVKLTHKNKRASTEKMLRTNVGIHLLAIIRAIEELCT